MQSGNSRDDLSTIDYLFYPRSVAIAGVSDDETKLSAGRMFTQTQISAGYKGKIYPVGSSGGEVFGLKIYPSIVDIPDTVDYVISAIPAKHTPQLLLDCATKGVRAIHLFTAGFSERGDEEGKQLESEITAIARQNGIRIIGPNCMGLYCPKTGLSYCLDFSRESGCVGYMAQSGGHAQFGVMEANARGIHFSKVISYGNACDLNEIDYLEYLTQDPETEMIAAYIEGVSDGRRFIEVLKQAAELKPVVIFKGGTTEVGARTTSSHTAAIAGSGRMWSSLIEQVGAIQVSSIEEMVDVLVLFKYLAPPKGRNTAVIGLGGGASVQAADDCSNAGLMVPLLPAEVSQKLKDPDFTDAGKFYQNPIDMFSHGDSNLMQRAINVIFDGDWIDLLLVHIPFDTFPTPEVKDVKQRVEALVNLAEELNKRTVVVLHTIALARSKQTAFEVQTTLWKAGFPVYPSVSRAASAINKFIDYHHMREVQLEGG